VTGEERRFADPEGKPANHLACTVEMTNLNNLCKQYGLFLSKFIFHSLSTDEVAVIDEIQMMRDPQRGWAWSRALLGKRHSLSLSYRSHPSFSRQAYKPKRFTYVVKVPPFDSFKN
jgi:hypothetical protein